jgi:hypothetical protein
LSIQNLNNELQTYDFTRFIEKEKFNYVLDNILNSNLSIKEKRDKLKKIMNLLLTKFIESLFVEQFIRK